MNYYMNSLNNSYLAVHTDALCANVAAIEKTLSPGAEIIPVLKCDAYGLSLSLTAPALAALPGIRTFALAHVSEGLALRALGIEKDALILGNPLPHAVPDAVNAHLTLTAGRLGLLPALAAAAEAAQTEVKIQIKIDTGLHRVGVPGVVGVLLGLDEFLQRHVSARTPVPLRRLAADVVQADRSAAPTPVGAVRRLVLRLTFAPVLRGCAVRFVVFPSHAVRALRHLLASIHTLRPSMKGRPA